MPSDNYFDKYDTPTQGAQVTPQESPPPTNANYFDKYDAGAIASPQQAPAGNNPNDQGALMAGVENFNRMFGSVAEGTMKVGADIASVFGANKQEMNQLKTNIDTLGQGLDQSAQAAAQQHPVAAGIGAVAGVLSQAAIPMGAAGKGASLFDRAVATGGPSALMGFLNNAPTYADRAANAGVAGLVGMAMPVAAQGYMKAADQLGMRGAGTAIDAGSGMIRKALDPQNAALDNASAAIKNAGAMDQTLANQAKFQAVGVPSSLADASQSAGITANLGAIPMNTARRGQIEQFRGAQTEAATGALNKELNQFVPGGLEANKDARNMAYSMLGTKTVPDDVYTQITANPAIKTRLDLINNNPDLGMSDVPDTSLAKMEAVRAELASDIWTQTKGLKTGERTTTTPGERTALRQSLSQFTNVLDQVYPEYKAARQLGDRVRNYELFQTELGHPTFVKGTGNEVTLDQMYSKLFGTPEKQDYFLDAVKSSGGNPENTKNLMDVLNLTKGSILDKAADKADNAAMGDASSTSGVIQSVAKWFTTKKYQDALLKLNLSPNWQDQLTTVLNKKGQDSKLVGLSTLVRKVADTNSPTMQNVKGNVGAGMLPGLAGQMQAAPQPQDQGQ